MVSRGQAPDIRAARSGGLADVVAVFLVRGKDLRVEFVGGSAPGFDGLRECEPGQPLPDLWNGLYLRSLGREISSSQNVATRLVTAPGGAELQLVGIPAGRSGSVLVVFGATSGPRRDGLDRELLENAAHELLSPLTAITTTLEALQRGAKEHPSQRDRLLENLEREAARLSRRSRALLLLARARTGREAVRLEQVRLRPLLEDIAEDIRKRRRGELELICPPELVAVAHADLLEHAVGNLVENAVRHGGDGPIRLSASSGSPDRSTAIEVRDRGAGMRNGDTSWAFQRFARGHAPGTPGSGLGLAIARECVEAIGGRVELECAARGGTTALLILPAQRPGRR